MPSIKNSITKATYELKTSRNGGSPYLSISGTTTYEVWADNCDQTFVDIANTSGLAVPGTSVGVSNAIYRSLDMDDSEFIDHPVTNVKARLWTVVASFDNELDEDGSGDYQNPTVRRAKVRFGGDLIEEVANFDLDHIPLKNAVGEPIFATRRRLIPTMEVTQLEPWPYPPIMLIVQGYKVNSQPFMGCPRGSVLLYPLEVDEVSEQGIRLNSVRYQFKFNLIEITPGSLQSIMEQKGKTLKDEDVVGLFEEDTWKDKFLHEGTKYRAFYTLAERDANAVENAPDPPTITANSTRLIDAVDANSNRVTVNLRGTIPFPNAPNAIREQYIGWRYGGNNFGDPVDVTSDDYTSKVDAGLGVPELLHPSLGPDYLVFRNIEYYDFNKLLLRMG